MGALAIPRKLSIYDNGRKKLCARIGLRIDGEDMGSSVVLYDLDAGRALVRRGDEVIERRGTIEPFWR